MPAVKEAPPGATRIGLSVSGMTCAACQATVQRALSKQPGVLNASVNLMTETAAVTFDPSVTTPDAIVGAIQRVGYEAEIPPTERDLAAVQEELDRTRTAEYEKVKRKAIVSGIIGAVAMIVSMSPMGASSIHPRVLS